MSTDLNWGRIQQAFGFDEAEMEELKNSPKQLRVLRAARRLVRARIIAEVVSAKGCEAHKVGDRYVYTGTGRLLPQESCQWLCSWAIAPVVPLVFMVYDRISSGLDPSDMVFDHVKCLDTGVKCGGFGETYLKVTVTEPQE